MQTQPRNDDAEHLRLLSIFHYIVGAIMGLFSLVPLIHLTVGLFLVAGAIPAEKGGDDKIAMGVVGLFFIVFAGAFIVLGLTTAVCVILTGRRLAEQTHYMFCLVTACVECLFMPFGTLLGVFTIIVLSRDSVKVLFGRLAPPPLDVASWR